jgi:hypothetical protein
VLRPASPPLPRWAQKGPDLGRAGAAGHQNPDFAPQTTPAPPHRGAPARGNHAAELDRRRPKHTVASKQPRAARRAHGKGPARRRQHHPGKARWPRRRRRQGREEGRRPGEGRRLGFARRPRGGRASERFHNMKIYRFVVMVCQLQEYYPTFR